ncbi:MAG: MBL fold metallo-hydrolase [Bacteroidetes bacterium]|nr:MBL fold metallo-hydrolase [Bacteroidota bacterium]
MNKKAAGIFLMLLSGILLLGWIGTGPSGNIQAYEAYYINDTASPAPGNVKLTFFGVSTLLLDDGETQLLVDGFFTRPSFLKVLTTRVATRPQEVDRLLAQYHINRVAGVLVAHSHYDHAMDAAYVAHKTGATLYGSLSTLNIGRGGGLNEQQMVLFCAGKAMQVGAFSIRAIPSRHSPPTLVNNDLGQTIDAPLRQPARITEYVEGDSYDFYIVHRGKRIYIKPSAHYIAGALDTLRADVLLLGTGALARQPEAFKAEYYQHTVGALKPRVVIPLHWDNFLRPVSDNLEMMPGWMDHPAESFDYLIAKTKADGIAFKILQGGKGMMLFAAEE